MESSFFEVAEPLDHDTFLSVCDDVLRDSLLLFAPFGLPRWVVRKVVPVACVRVHERLLGLPALSTGLSGHILCLVALVLRAHHSKI